MGALLVGVLHFRRLRWVELDVSLFPVPLLIRSSPARADFYHFAQTSARDPRRAHRPCPDASRRDLSSHRGAVQPARLLDPVPLECVPACVDSRRGRWSHRPDDRGRHVGFLLRELPFESSMMLTSCMRLLATPFWTSLPRLDLGSGCSRETGTRTRSSQRFRARM